MLIRAMNAQVNVVIFIAISWITVASVLSCNRAPSRTIADKPKTVTSGRDLSAYDLGGSQGCGIVLKTELPKYNASLKNARDFIWNHWTDRRRGYVIVTMASDDAESDAHIFIELDELNRVRPAILAILETRDLAADFDRTRPERQRFQESHQSQALTQV